MLIILSSNLDRVAFAVACDVLQVSKLCDQDYQFLAEFAQVFKPVADSITQLEGKVPFGCYLPILFTCRDALKDMYVSDALEYCGPLLVAVKDGFDKRFGHLMRLGDVYERPDPKAVPLFLSMITNPEFKMKCVPHDWLHRNANGIAQIRNILLNAMKQILQGENNSGHGGDNLSSNQSGNDAGAGISLFVINIFDTYIFH